MSRKAMQALTAFLVVNRNMSTGGCKIQAVVQQRLVVFSMSFEPSGSTETLLR